MRLSILLLYLIFVLGCQTSPKWSASDILVKDNENFQTKSELTASEVDSDISFLVYAMENGYGGRKYIPDSKFESAISSIKKIKGAMSSEDFKDRIDEALLQIPDNHLKARLNGSPSPNRAMRSKIGNIGKNKTPKSKTWEVKKIKEGNKDVLFVSITEFPSHKDKVWDGFIESVKSKMKGTDVAVIDFRGNGGGDDTIGLELAELFFGGKAPYPVNQQFVSQTPETLAIFVNNFQVRSLKRKQKGEKVPSYYDELKSEKLNEFNLALAGKLPAEKVRDWKSGEDKFNPQTGYAKPIYILMDGKCGSSCESTIDGFESHPMAKKVGQNTAGYIHFGNIGYILLPNSKIEVQTPTHYNRYRDGRFVEIVGLTPDVKVPDGEDAYAFIFKNLVR